MTRKTQTYLKYPIGFILLTWFLSGCFGKKLDEIRFRSNMTGNYTIALNTTEQAQQENISSYTLDLQDIILDTRIASEQIKTIKPIAVSMHFTSTTDSTFEQFAQLEVAMTDNVTPMTIAKLDTSLTTTSDSTGLTLEDVDVKSYLLSTPLAIQIDYALLDTALLEQTLEVIITFQAEGSF